MIIQEIKDKNIWEDFVGSCFERTFLHSWNWGEFNRAMGNKIWRLGVYEQIANGESQMANLVGAALIVKIQAKRGTFLFCPHGPVIKYQISNIKYQISKALLDYLKNIAKDERADFIRVAPIWLESEENISIFKKLGFRKAPIHIHPEITWELNIELSEDELLKNMRKTTRYLIKKAQKDGVKIVQNKNSKTLEIFNKLYQETVNRHRFVPFSPNYIKNEFQSFLNDNQVSLFFAKYQNEIIVSAMIIFWQGIAFYHQGASSQKYPKIPASYLLQWEAIKEAKKRNCQTYDFWGIAPPNSKSSHRFAGVTLFKTGFGGEMKELVKTQDFPISSKYWFNFIVELARKKARHLG